eukprot:TRINITY_DN12867_c0_g1_i2.p1 TRINITY_DN12867_c0_g1~~TRINITY_DN12867_c0_g1_i2.p1  ORF type:complete len:133 (+),score=41.46 TRINITY_DN12867_c0_g1_i2:175-573(+)
MCIRDSFGDECEQLVTAASEMSGFYSLENLYTLPLPMYVRGDAGRSRGHQDGVVLVGDAAHPLSIFTSQGLNSALCDSRQLARCIASWVERGGNKDELSGMVEEFYSARAEQVLEYTEQGSRMVAELSLIPI